VNRPGEVTQNCFPGVLVILMIFMVASHCRVRTWGGCFLAAPWRTRHRSLGIGPRDQFNLTRYVVVRELTRGALGTIAEVRAHSTPPYLAGPSLGVAMRRRSDWLDSQVPVSLGPRLFFPATAAPYYAHPLVDA
jgi:hypothetical protein